MAKDPKPRRKIVVTPFRADLELEDPEILRMKQDLARNETGIFQNDDPNIQNDPMRQVAFYRVQNAGQLGRNAQPITPAASNARREAFTNAVAASRKNTFTPPGSAISLDKPQDIANQQWSIRTRGEDVFGDNFVDSTSGGLITDPLMVDAAERVKFASRLGRNAPRETQSDLASRADAKLTANAVRKDIKQKGAYTKDTGNVRLTRDKNGAKIELIQEPLSIRAARMFAGK